MAGLATTGEICKVAYRGIGVGSDGGGIFHDPIKRSKTGNQVMVRLKNLLDSWPAFAVSALWLVVFGILHLWPASWWFDVRSVHVGHDLTMVVDRTIKRPFRGEWLASVRRWEGGWVLACVAKGSSYYKQDAKLPAKLDLAWWTDGGCKTLPAGKYMLTTAWTITGLGLLPDKVVSVDSLPFEVN